MIIVLKPNCTQEQIDHIVERLTELKLRPEVSKGIKRTLIGVIGEDPRSDLRRTSLGATHKAKPATV